MNLQMLVFSLSLGMVFFVLASGFSLIYGLMRILNYAHTSFVMWGAYITYNIFRATGNLFLGLFVAIAVVTTAGALIEIFLIRRVEKNYTDQLLLSFGLVYILNDITKIFFGTGFIFPMRPPFLEKTIMLGNTLLPVYRLLLIALGIVVFAGLSLLINKTRLGIIITAGTERPRMVRASGINIQAIFTLTFCIGSALAALGGGFACFFLGLYPNLANDQLFNILIVVIIGGIGSIKGTFIASILVGLVQYVVGYYFPIAAMGATILLLILVLIIRPEGLLKAGGRGE